jgi:hypothetical protein
MAVYFNKSGSDSAGNSVFPFPVYLKGRKIRNKRPGLVSSAINNITPSHQNPDFIIKTFLLQDKV